MNSTVSLDDVRIRTELRPGDLGYMIHRQARIYAEEYGYGISFEAYVAAGTYEFCKAFDPERDCVWICEHDSMMVGFMLLMHRENNAAQLRYFYLEPAYRGIGLGKKMMELYMGFLKQCGYSSSYLWTTHELPAAAALYLRHGFRLTEEKPSNAFGKPVIEQRYDLARVE